MLHRLPFDIMHAFLSGRPAPQITQMASVSTDLQVDCNHILQSRIRKHIQDFMYGRVTAGSRDVVGRRDLLVIFLRQLHVTGSIIAGTSARRMVDPDAIIGECNHLVLHIPEDMETKWLFWIIKHLDYEIDTCEPTTAHPKPWGFSRVEFICKTNTRKRICVSVSPGPSPLFWVFMAPTTQDMNLLTARALICMYPKLANQRAQLLSGRIYLLKARWAKNFIHNCMKKIKTFSHHNLLVDPEDGDKLNCRCTPYCVNEMRNTRDGLSMVFEHGLAPLDDIEGVNPWNVFAEWRLGGYDCLWKGVGSATKPYLDMHDEMYI